MPDLSLRRQLQAYAARWPQEAEVAAQFLALLDDAQDPFVRDRLDGHFTGSAWLVSADGARTLLTHQRCSLADMPTATATWRWWR